MSFECEGRPVEREGGRDLVVFGALRVSLNPLDAPFQYLLYRIGSEMFRIAARGCTEYCGDLSSTGQVRHSCTQLLACKGVAHDHSHQFARH